MLNDSVVHSDVVAHGLSECRLSWRGVFRDSAATARSLRSVAFQPTNICAVLTYSPYRVREIHIERTTVSCFGLGRIQDARAAGLVPYRSGFNTNSIAMYVTHLRRAGRQNDNTCCVRLRDRPDASEGAIQILGRKAARYNEPCGLPPLEL